MSLERAVELVVAAERRDDPDDTAELTDSQVVEDVVQRLSPSDTSPRLMDYEDDETSAYLVLLAHHYDPTREELLSVLRGVARGGSWRPSVVEEVWLNRLERGHLK
jgi:hypothetical protein